MSVTLDYYNNNAQRFIKDTVDARMSEIQEHFLKCLEPGAMILDLGCGSGRDSLAFIRAGYTVRMVDGSVKMAEAASDLTGEEVRVSTFQTFETEEMFDGIWACASLLHLTTKEIRDTASRLAGNLNIGGVFYMSYKYGEFSGQRNGRFFTDMTESRIRETLADVKSLEMLEAWVSTDVRPEKENEKMAECIVEKI